MADFQGQTVNSAGALGVVAISSDINHLVGTTATNLVRPAAKTTIVLFVESGTFRFRTGDYDGSPNTALASGTPGTSKTDGTGSFALTVGDKLVFAAPSNLSVVGASSSDVLTYWYT